MESLLEQLHDIEGLDPISSWPLAIGYWVLIAIAFAIFIGIFTSIYLRIKFNRSWKKDTLLKLADLEKNLAESTSRDTVISLSEYLKRIAVKRHSRNECASLSGSEWLKWLSANDLNQFDWVKKGSLLIETPYAPTHIAVNVESIRDLIHATKKWVR